MRFYCWYIRWLAFKGFISIYFIFKGLIGRPGDVTDRLVISSNQDKLRPYYGYWAPQPNTNKNGIICQKRCSPWVPSTCA